MANVKAIIAAHLSQRQRNINKEVERADFLDQDRLLCNIIRVDSNIAVPSRPGFVWCQEYSPSDDTSPFHAFNDKVQAREGLSVWIGPGLGGRREVLEWNNATIVNTADYAAQKYLPTHHTDHEWPDFKPGADVVNVYPRSLSMLRTYPGEAGALTVSASPLRYIKSNALILFPGKNSLDISASQPASGLARFVGIYLDPDDNTLKSVNGATTGDSPTITPDSPAFPESAILSANVRLNGDQTTFSEVDIVDTRQILDSSGAIDGTRISKLVSPDGLTDPVFSADNSGDVTLAGTGTLIIPTDLIHAGDTDTKLSFTDDDIELTVGSLSMLKLTETAQDLVEIGDVAGGGDVDINFNNDQMVLVGSTGDVGIGTLTPGGQIDSLIADGTAQLRLSFSATKFLDFIVDTNHDTTITPSSTGQVKFQPTTDSTDFLQVLDADGGNPILNVDSTNERIGFGTDTPTSGIHILNEQSLTMTVERPTVNGVPSLEFKNDATNYRFQIRGDSSDEFVIRTGSGGGTLPFKLFDTAPTNSFIIAASGNIGINGVISPSTELDIGAGAIELDEMTSPGAGAANTARFFARDDGGGDTELCVRFNSGLIQVVAPLEFGGISVIENASQTTITTANVAAQITIFDTNEPSNGTTPDHTNDHITVSKAGTYLISCSVTAISIAGAAAKWHFDIQKNNGTTVVGQIHGDRNLSGGGGDAGSISMSGLAVLSSGDTIEAWVTNETNTQNIIVEDINLAIVMAGVNV